jgi:hypothetical protein
MKAKPAIGTSADGWAGAPEFFWHMRQWQMAAETGASLMR